MKSAEAVQAVVFDMDGLLLDTTPMLVVAYSATVESLTGRIMKDSDLFEVWHHGTVRATLGELIGRIPSDEEVSLHLDNVDHALSILRPYDGIPTAVEMIADKVPVAVFTSSTRAYAERCLRACDLDQFFSGRRLIAAEDVVHPKPNGEGLLVICERFGISPDNAAYVGDARNDMLAARDAGALAIAGRWGHYFTEDIPADIICDTPADVVSLLTNS